MVQKRRLPDRTRAIFPGSEKSISLNITNDSASMPYLAQGWIEDEQGKKISGPLVVVPPLQRLEAKSKSVMRINAMPDASLLPQDKESLFILTCAKFRRKAIGLT